MLQFSSRTKRNQASIDEVWFQERLVREAGYSLKTYLKTCSGSKMQA
jgi:hypothetical protein